MKKLKIWLITLCLLISFFPCSVFAAVEPLPGMWNGPTYTDISTGKSVTLAEKRVQKSQIAGRGEIYDYLSVPYTGEVKFSTVWQFVDITSSSYGGTVLYWGNQGNSPSYQAYSITVYGEQKKDTGTSYDVYVDFYYLNSGKHVKNTFILSVPYDEVNYVYKTTLTLNYDTKTVQFDFMKSPYGEDIANCDWSLFETYTFEVDAIIEAYAFNNYYKWGISRNIYTFAMDYESEYDTIHIRPMYSESGYSSSPYSFAAFNSDWQLLGFVCGAGGIKQGSTVFETYDWVEDSKKFTVYGKASIVTDDKMIRYLLQKTYPITNTTTATKYFSRIYSSYIKTLQATPLEYITIMKNKYTPVSGLFHNARFNTSYYHIMQKETDKIWNIVSNKTDAGFTLTFNKNAKVQNSFIMRYDVWKDIVGTWTLKWLYEKGYVDYSTVGNNQVIYGRDDDIDDIKNGLFSKDAIKETIDFEKVVTTMDDLYSYDTEGKIKKFCYYASPVYYNEEDGSYEWYYLVTYSGGYNSELKDIYNYYSYVSDKDGSKMYRMYDSIQPLSWNNPKDLLFDKQNDWKYVDHNIKDVVYKTENYQPSLDKNVIERDENVPIFNETTESEALENIGFKNLINAINGFMNEFSWFTDTLDTVQYYLLEYFYSCDNLISGLNSPQYLDNMKWMSDNLDWLYKNTILKYPVDFGLVTSIVFAIIF